MSDNVTKPLSLASLPINRRAALGGGAAAFMTMALMPKPSAAAQSAHKLDLFAFMAPKSRNLVFAVTFKTSDRPSEGRVGSDYTVRIHVNEHRWTINGPLSTQQRKDSENRCYRCFSGEVFGRRHADEILNAAVVETPPQLVGNAERLAVWAELFAANGSRRRVGSPFIAELMAQEPTMSTAYHAASPKDDVALLAEVLSRRATILANANGNVADPGGHARRLCSHFLPDVIEYRPNHPVGFNFVSQNGRHPADDPAAIVATVLTGAVTAGRSSRSIQLSEAFPYFVGPNMGPAKLGRIGATS